MKIDFKVPSEMFREAFSSNGSGCRRECQCGRIWFDGDGSGYTWDPGEFEMLCKLSKSSPDHCVEVRHSVPTYYFKDTEIVWDCACQYSTRAAEFEHTVLAEPSRVARLLNKLADHHRKIANQIEVKEVSRE